jgi:bacterioferritin-associated ferredoxin
MTAEEIVRALAAGPAPTIEVSNGRLGHNRWCGCCHCDLSAVTPEHKPGCAYMAAQEWVKEHLEKSTNQCGTCPEWHRLSAGGLGYCGLPSRVERGAVEAGGEG